MNPVPFTTLAAAMDFVVGDRNYPLSELFMKGGFIMWPLLLLSIAGVVVLVMCCFSTRASAVLPTKLVEQAESFIRLKARTYLDNNKIVIFAAGTGNPFFSTDTTAALRASEINAEVVMKATSVDGVYDADPKKVSDAKRFDAISYQECLERQLKVMDSTAFTLCMDNKKPIIVFDMHTPGNITRALLGEPIGTTIS